MALTNKTIASSYQDLLQVDNSGSGRTANGTIIKDGLGNSTALTLGGDKVALKPSSDSTALLTVENASGTDLLVVDSTNSAVKAGTTQTHVTTQIQRYGVYDAQPTAGKHHSMFVDQSLHSSATSLDFGTGTDPATSLTVANSTGLHSYDAVASYWYVPTAITIDEVRVLAAAEASVDLNFHLYSYTLATGTGSTAGDLSSGTLLSHNGSVLAANNDRMVTTTLTVDSANVAADKVIVATFENVTDTNDVTVQLIVKYHYQ